MKFHLQQAIRAAILLAFTIFLFRLHNTKEIFKYINPQYELLSQTGAFLFLVLFLTQLHRIWAKESCSSCCTDQTHHHDHGDGRFSLKKLLFYVLIFLPVASGSLLPIVSLDSTIAAQKGTMLSLRNDAMSSQKEPVADTPGESSENDQEEMPIHELAPDPNLNSNGMTKEEYENWMVQLKKTDQIVLNDAVYSSYYQEINTQMEHFNGKEIKLQGFLYREHDFKPGQFVIGRFLITHCLADSSVIGFLSELPDAETLKEDIWVEATGKVKIETYDGVPMPVLKIDNWKEITQPQQPYVYPVTITVI